MLYRQTDNTSYPSLNGINQKRYNPNILSIASTVGGSLVQVHHSNVFLGTPEKVWIYQLLQILGQHMPESLLTCGCIFLTTLKTLNHLVTSDSMSAG